MLNFVVQNIDLDETPLQQAAMLFDFINQK